MLSEQLNTIEKDNMNLSGIRFMPLFIIFYIFACANWHIFSTYVGIDGARRVPFLLGIVVALLTAKLMFRVKSVLLWFLWILYAIINSIEQGINYEATPTVLNLVILLMLPFFMMTASLYYTVLNSRKMLWLIFAATAVCCAEMCWRSGMLQNFSLQTRMSSGSEAGINANEFGITLALLLISGIHLFLQTQKKYKVIFWSFVFVILLLILRTASRTAVVLAITGSIFSVLLLEKKIFKKLLLYLIITIIAVSVATPFIEQTAIFERFQTTKHQMIQFDWGDSFIAQKLGDRAMYYYFGSDIFAAHPIRGVGFYNYMFHNPVGPWVCHVEYMAQLSEEGIIGTCLFLLFYLSIAGKLIRHINKRKSPLWASSCVIFLTICVANGATYSSWRVIYFMFFGYILGNLYLLENAADEDANAARQGENIRFRADEGRGQEQECQNCIQSERLC